MPPIVSFIGWHDSGKTTLAARVVTHLKQLGYTIAVIKSTKETAISFDTPDTDTGRYRAAGADCVSLVAPDQMVVMTPPTNLDLIALAHRYFQNVDIIIAEGFKHASRVPKIEVTRDADNLLRDTVEGVIATATDCDLQGSNIFGLDQVSELAGFIEQRFLSHQRQTEVTTVLRVNGKKIALKQFIRKNLAATIAGYVNTLKIDGPAEDIELRVRINKPEL